MNPDAPRAVGGNAKKIPEPSGIDMKLCGNFYLVFEYVQVQTSVRRDIICDK